MPTITATLKLNKKLQKLLSNLLAKHDLVGKTAIFNFTNPDYTAEAGGFHPVEIMIDVQNRIEYITDFSYTGVGVYAELAKEIDFDFVNGECYQHGFRSSLESASSLFKLWESNFFSVR